MHFVSPVLCDAARTIRIAFLARYKDIGVLWSVKVGRPNPSLNTDVPHAGAARRAAGRRLASIR